MGDLLPPYIDRRQFLRSILLAAGVVLLPGCGSLIRRPKDVTCGQEKWPTYYLSREIDEIFIKLTARGFSEKCGFGYRYLERLECDVEPLLVFTFPPQHYAETAIAVGKIPEVMSEEKLEKVILLPSSPAQIVFRVTGQDRINLRLEDLLAWERFQLVLPKLESFNSQYELDVKDNPEHPFTRIEMPRGVELTPLGRYGHRLVEHDSGPQFYWQHSTLPVKIGDWAVLWTTVLQNAHQRNAPNKFELFSVKGFQVRSRQGNVDDGTLTITYDDIPGYGSIENSDRSTPLTNLDRISLAANLSRRFRYTGKPGTTPVESALLAYDAKGCVNACYLEGRTIPVDQFRLSSRGGSLDLETTWKTSPSCALVGWTHSASLGRDHHVKLIYKGFLYPFGIEANLIVLSDRTFVKDPDGHYVALLVKQAFLEVPQPNAIEVLHRETLFPRISVTTTKTPPLDRPPDGDPDTYSKYDYFLPTVDHVPFQFEHVGIDWAGRKHFSRMPMFFVSQKATSSNGLIWEPGYCWNHSQQSSTCSAPSGGASDNDHMIPKSGDGLRVLDKKWNAVDYRFAKYGEELIALARPHSDGDTTQRVVWAEWTRGQVQDLDPAGIVDRPFLPRVRTVKLRLQGIGEFSGQATSSIGTYRDVRFASFPILDPEPTAPSKLYRANVADEGVADRAVPYLYLLEVRELVGEGQAPPQETDEAKQKRIKALYYGVATPEALIADELFNNINNEIKFGLDASTEGTGGVAPDTHVSVLTRLYGPVGDSTFNESKWPGYAKAKGRLQAANRLDYAAFRKAHRQHIDITPFDQSRTEADIQALAQLAFSTMQYAGVVSGFGLTKQIKPPMGLSLADLFGGQAEIIPGLSFSTILESVALRELASDSEPTLLASPAGRPPKWEFKMSDLDWLYSIIGSGPGRLSASEMLELAIKDGQVSELSTPMKFGMEASLEWVNNVFSKEAINFGPVTFQANSNTSLKLSALARIDFSIDDLADFLSAPKVKPSAADVASSAEMRDFVVTVFNAIEIVFSRVSFKMTAGGKKEFSVNIGSVNLKGSLSFLGELSKILGGLGESLGIDIDITSSSVRIGQKIGLPPKVGTPLLIGPAQVINLVLGWGVMIPLIGRDVLTVSFALSSRDKPLTIFVPPWYGGKAHILIEATTKGMRLLEVSMEYGALIPIEWGIAKGEASLTAGIFYYLEKVVDSKGDLVNGKVEFRAFVKAVASLQVAGIIHFEGMIYIGLDYIEVGSRKIVRGQSIVSVSIKIGFIRVSYSFTAQYEQEARSDTSRASSGQIMLAALGEIVVDAPERCVSSLPPGETGDIYLFSPRTGRRQLEAFDRIIDGYRKVR